ncbi:MAG: hypothetical protein AB1295_00675 [Candidatus Micrarchaeota archaeon]
MDKELAELIGILLGDGSLGIYTSNYCGKIRTQYRIKVTLNSEKDARYSIYVCNLFVKVFGRKPKTWKRPGEKTLDLYLLGKSSLSFLTELGMVLAPKWGRARIPERFLEVPLDRYVLRGYMDTDGCVCAVNNNGIRYPRIEMKICPSPMQGQLIRAMLRNGFRPQINSLERGKIRVVLAGLKNLALWSRGVGFSNERNLSMAKSFLIGTTNKASL